MVNGKQKAPPSRTTRKAGLSKKGGRVKLPANNGTSLPKRKGKVMNYVLLGVVVFAASFLGNIIVALITRRLDK